MYLYLLLRKAFTPIDMSQRHIVWYYIRSYFYYFKKKSCISGIQSSITEFTSDNEVELPIT